MLNPIEINSKLATMGEAVKCEVLLDMKFRFDSYDFFNLKFQKEIQLQNLLKYFVQ